MSLLPFGNLSPQACHLCVDVQTMFAEGSVWAMPWVNRVLPQIKALAQWAAPHNYFTQFMTPDNPALANGRWKSFYEKWPQFTREAAPQEWFKIVADLQPFIQPGQILQKYVYSPWQSGELHQHLMAHHYNTLVISGGETDVCVLATVLGAIDLGYRVIIARDATCSSNDETHDSTLKLLQKRFDVQVEVAGTEDILNAWPRRI